jgi:hypothetical protein
MQYKNILLVLAGVIALKVVNVEFAQATQPAPAPTTTVTAPATTGNTAPADALKKHKKHKKKPVTDAPPSDAPPAK